MTKTSGLVFQQVEKSLIFNNRPKLDYLKTLMPDFNVTHGLVDAFSRKHVYPNTRGSKKVSLNFRFIKIFAFEP